MPRPHLIPVPVGTPCRRVAVLVACLAGLLGPGQGVRAESIDVAGPSAAQPAPADQAPAVPDDGQPSAWQGRMTASLSLAAGNSRSSAAQADLDIARQRDGGKTTLTAQVSESQSGTGQDRETTAARWGGTAQHNRDIDAEYFAFARIGLEHDRVIDLQARTQAALGLGRHVLSLPDHQLEVFSGLGRTVSRYRHEQTIDGETDSRFSSNVVLIGSEYTGQLSPTVSLKQRLEGYLSVDGDRNQIFKLSAALNVDMTRTLALTVTLSDAYSSRVAAGQRRNDLSLSTGLSVKIGP